MSEEPAEPLALGEEPQGPLVLLRDGGGQPRVRLELRLVAGEAVEVDRGSEPFDEPLQRGIELLRARAVGQAGVREQPVEDLDGPLADRAQQRLAGGPAPVQRRAADPGGLRDLGERSAAVARQVLGGGIEEGGIARQHLHQIPFS